VVYVEDVPAALLFRDFSGWSQRATRLFYAENGVQFTAEQPPAGTSVTPAVRARASGPLPGAFHHLFLLALGELVTLCEAAEKACGIRPIRIVA
jgi:hypothetical protein